MSHFNLCVVQSPLFTYLQLITFYEDPQIVKMRISVNTGWCYLAVRIGYLISKTKRSRENKETRFQTRFLNILMTTTNLKILFLVIIENRNLKA